MQVHECEKMIEKKMYAFFSFVQFNPGDTICVLDDVKIVRRLQEGHGGWVEPMSKVC